MLASFGSCICAGAGADNKDAPKPLPPEIVKAWRDAGADVGWMKDLPVDEAVPMLFRMEPDRRRAHAGPDARGDFALREPLCLTSVGISTREPWPRDLTSRRIYIFPDHGWAADGVGLQAERALAGGEQVAVREHRLGERARRAVGDRLDDLPVGGVCPPSPAKPGLRNPSQRNRGAKSSAATPVRSVQQ